MNEMVTVAEASSEFEAEAIRAVLSDAGIESMVPPTGSSIFGFPMVYGKSVIPVRVLAEQLSDARQVLAQAKWMGKSVDWDDVDVGDMPPEVQRVLERGKAPSLAGSFLVAFGALVLVIIAALAVIAGVAWLMSALRGGRLALAAAALAAAALGSGGCGYQLKGRAVEGYGGIVVTDASDSGAQARGLPGVTVELIRDANRTSRERVATATSGKDGSFTLDVSAFGAGWMQEEWLVRASRRGFQNAESVLNLPGSAGGRLLLVSLARGKSEPFVEPESTRSLMDEARQYEPGVGGSRR